MTGQAAAGPDENIFRFQARAMPVLLGWAAGSILAGAFWSRERSAWLRGFGGQFVGWGAINALIAFFGWRGASRSAARFAQGEISQEEHTRQQTNFVKIVAVNTALDVGYVAAGAWLARQESEEWQGMGWGIIVQGAFLFVWDAILTWLAARKRHAA